MGSCCQSENRWEAAAKAKTDGEAAAKPKADGEAAAQAKPMGSCCQSESRWEAAAKAKADGKLLPKRKPMGKLLMQSENRWEAAAESRWEAAAKAKADGKLLPKRKPMGSCCKAKTDGEAACQPKADADEEMVLSLKIIYLVLEHSIGSNSGAEEVSIAMAALGMVGSIDGQRGRQDYGLFKAKVGVMNVQVFLI